MKKTIFKAISVFLCVLMALSAVTTMAAEETETYFGASSGSAYGTDIEYIPETETYVMGGKGLYTSKDGVNWYAHSNAVSDVRDNTEYYGMAYGGAENDRKLILITDSLNANVLNKIFILDKYLTMKRTVYTYIGGEVQDGSDDTPLMLKGGIIWDNYTQKFWCGASLADRTGAGLYYSDGATVEKTVDEKLQLAMYWKKADTECSSFKPDAVYTDKTTQIRPVFTNITSDGKGHIAAQPAWATYTDKYTYSTARSTATKPTAETVNEAGSPSCNVPVIATVAADGSVTAKIYDYSTADRVVLNYFGLDQKGNVIVQSFTMTSDQKSAVISNPRVYPLEWLLKKDSGLLINKANFIQSSNTIANPAGKFEGIQSNLRGSHVGKALTVGGNIVLVPFTSGKAAAGALKDIVVGGYPTDTGGLIKNGLKAGSVTTFINNAATVNNLIGTGGGNQYLVKDALVCKDNSVLLLIGKNTPVSQAFETGPSKVIKITGLGNAFEKNTDDHSANVTITDKAKKLYSHITATAEQTSVVCKPGDTITFNANVIQSDFDSANNPVIAEGAAYTLEIVSGDYNNASSILAESMEGNSFDVSEDAPIGDYKYGVKITAEGMDGMAQNEIEYVVKVRDAAIDVNGTDVSDSRTSVNLKSGLRTGENTITVTPQRAFAVDSLTKIIAVYKDGSLVTCNSVNEASNGGVPERFSLTFNISEDENPDDYSYKVLFWSKALQPL